MVNADLAAGTGNKSTDRRQFLRRRLGHEDDPEDRHPKYDNGDQHDGPYRF
jgi:hypothetical protein